MAYIAERNPAVALVAASAIRSAIDQLSDYPRMGRAGRVGGTRELVVARTPFIVIHVVQADTVQIVRVLHAAQRGRSTLTATPLPVRT